MTDKCSVTSDLVVDELVSELKEFSLSATIHKKESSESALPIATNEFYYNLGLQQLEKFAADFQTTSHSVKKRKREKPKIRKMDKNDDKFNVKLKTSQEKLQNLTITVKNDKVQKSPGQSKQIVKKGNNKMEKEKVSLKDTNPLLQHLKQLQKDQVSMEKFQRRNPLAKLKKSALNREDDAKRNKEEVQRLNSLIQEKISQKIRPKLSSIIDGQENPTLPNGLNDVTRKKTISESSHREHHIVPESRVEKQQARRERAVKTSRKLLTEEEFDSFLLKLLRIVDAEELKETILVTAEARKIIKRFGPTDFDFCLKSTKEHLEKNEKLVARQANDYDDDGKKCSLEIERIKSIAKNDDELNELIYQHEFGNIFENAFEDPAVKNLPFAEIVKHIVDSKQGYIIEGEVRVNGKNNQEAYVSNPRGKRDVCISKIILRKHSYQGDFVRVLVRDDGDDRLNLDGTTDDELDSTLQSKVNYADRNFGCVLEILEKRNSRRVIGSLSAASNGNKKHRRYVQFNVRDPKIPNVNIGWDGIPKDVEISDKMLMVVEITSWSHDQPKGKIVEFIGEKGQLKAENAAILIQHNLNPQPFSQKILDELPTEPFAIPAEEFAYRQDLRKKCIFSIDPETARDLDDALSCEKLPNGNLEIGVHISDVTYFLKENSELDEIVKEKATTIYLVDTVYHMLPVPLCLLCSLLPGSDKMAYSVFWEMNEETAEIVNTRFTRSVVNSCGKLSYDHAQKVIEKEDQNWSELEVDFPEIYNGFSVSDVANVIVKLQKLAVNLRKKRKENGALKIDQPKIAFKFDKDDQRMDSPVDFFQYCIKDSNRLIEEFMLLANISVAKFIYEKFPEISLLRHHEPPNDSGLKKLVKSLQKSKIEIDVSSSSALSASMEHLIDSASSTAGTNAALNLLVSKTMSRARYFCSVEAEDESAFWHYALSIPIYTHFTSPIRRYADVLVHRVLNAALGYEAPPSRSPEEVQQLANVCNAQKYSAKLAGDDSSNLYFMQFIKSHKSKMMVAGVVGIYDYNLEVVLVETGHVLKVFYKNLQQNDDVIIKAFTDNEPPYVTAIWPKLNSSNLKIVFGSELMIEISVVKDKLVANRIFYHCK